MSNLEERVAVLRRIIDILSVRHFFISYFFEIHERLVRERLDYDKKEEKGKNGKEMRTEKRKDRGKGEGHDERKKVEEKGKSEGEEENIIAIFHNSSSNF